jgi:DNA-binding response OmpR family regulator
MKNKRILIVEDDATLSHSIGFTLRRYGYDVTATRSGREALERILQSQLKPRPLDLLITDIRLPDMTGTELIGELARRGALPTTLVMTAYATRGLFDGLRHLGVRECLAKPFDIMELGKRVSTLLQ